MADRIFKNCRNPVLPSDIYIPDSEAHVMPDGRVYVYGSWDQQDKDYCSREYRVFSSDNMRDWVDHGRSFSADWVPWFDGRDTEQYDCEDPFKLSPMLQKKRRDQPAPDVKAPEEEATLLFAPDCIEKDGTYYMYFCGSDQSEGVATAKCPQGPFKNPIRLHCGGIDPAIFMDRDGQPYYYWGQISGKGCKLRDNMVELDEDSIVTGLVTEQEHFFHEGSSMRRRGDTYYLVYADMQRGRPTSLGYATSKSPLGPFVYQGIIIDNTGCDPASWNNHGSIEEVNGQWYVFYHRSSRNSVFRRRLCVEPIYFNEDGTIPEVEMTSQGAGLPYAMGEEAPAEAACLLSGSCYLDRDEKRGREKLTAIAAGDTAQFKYFEFAQSPQTAVLTVRGKGRVRIFAGEVLLGEAILTEGENKVKLTGKTQGKQCIRLEFAESDALDFYSIRFDTI